MAIKLIVVGAAGRMGQRITDLALKDPTFEPFYGLETGGKQSPLAISSGSDRSVLVKGDVAIDFTIAEATLSLLPEMVKARKPYVIGTTGFDANGEKAIAEAARTIPIVKSYNMSLGVNVFFRVAQQIAKVLPGYSFHIDETHHVHKKDAPSGTALQAGRLIEEASGKKVTYESFREGEVVGDHRVIIQGPTDRIELFHHADSRDIFASGALEAAKWVVKQKPGLYNMFDVLGV